MDKKVSVVVPTINRKSLANCLESLANQAYENYEVIVVSCDEGAKNVVSKFNFKFLLSEKANVSAQRNIGIKAANGEIIAFTDDDAIADVNWLSQLMKHYASEHVVCVGGKIIPKFLCEVPNFLKDLPPEIFKGFISETLLNFDEATAIDKPLLWGSNISFRKSVFDEIGLFDEKLGRTKTNLMGGEEIELQRKILREEVKLIYEPNAIVTHLIDEERLTKLWFLKRSFWQGYSDILALRKLKKFKNLLEAANSEQDLFRYIGLIKLMEFTFELIGSVSLKEKIDAAKKMGRVAAFSSLMR